MKLPTSKNYQIRNLHSYIKKDDLDALISLLNQKPLLLNFKNFKNENILFYSLFCNSKKISSYLMIQKPSLLLERNNLGRNPAQNLASKKMNLDLIFKGLSLLQKEDIYQVFSNVDNLGNNLLMYSALYNDISYYNKSLNVCPNTHTLINVQNKRKSNVLHFLASNPYSVGEIELDKHDKNLFLQTTVNNSTVAMFSAENQPTERFTQYINKYKEILNKQEFLEYLNLKNTLSFNILDFSLLNNHHGNAKYLIDNHSSELKKDFSLASLLTIIKAIIKNDNFQSYEIMFDFYQPLKDEANILPILKTVLTHNDKNPHFLNYILDNHMDMIMDLFTNYIENNSIYELSLDKLNNNQWITILKYIEKNNEEHKKYFNEKEISTLFLLMTYNPKYQEKNLELLYQFLSNTRNLIDVENYFAQKLLYLPDNTVKSFLNNGFLDKCKNKDIDALIYILQEVYDTNNKIPLEELNISMVVNQHLTSYNSTFEINKNITLSTINNFRKIIDNQDIFTAFSQISHIQSTIVNHLAKSETPFTDYVKISKYLTEHEQQHLLGSLIYEVAYIPEGKVIFKKSEWDIFKDVYPSIYLSLVNLHQNDKLEAAENLFDIFNNQISPHQNINEQFHFLNFISHNLNVIENKNNHPNPPLNYSFVQNLKNNLLKEITKEPIDEQAMYSNQLLQINTQLFKIGLPLNIPENILNLASKKLKINYKKEKNNFLLSSFEKEIGFNFLNHFYSQSKIDYLTLDEIVKTIPTQLNDTNIPTLQNKKQSYIELFYPYTKKIRLLENIEHDVDKIIIEAPLFNQLINDYLTSGQINHALSLQQIYLEESFFEIPEFKIIKNKQIQINPVHLNNFDILDIYAFHEPEKLIKYKYEILENINHFIKKGNQNHINHIRIINLLEILDALDTQVTYIKDIIEDNGKKFDAYHEYINTFISRNKDSTIFDHIDYSKISDIKIQLILEEAYLNRNLPVNEHKNKVKKY